MPIVGSGDIASAIIDRPDRLYFASGVSNSLEWRVWAYMREMQLLWEQPRDAHIVYFSSLSIYYANTPYTDHKREMERLIRKLWPLHAIVRIGNITWGSNPYTLINHLRARHAAGLPLDIQDVYRYITDKPTFQTVLANIPDDQPFEFNCLGRRLKVADIVHEFVLSAEVAA